MSTANREWKVLPHGPVEEIDDGVLTVEGDLRMPLVRLPRRMTIARLHDGRLVVFSAIALDDAGMAKIEAAGRPAFLVVPNAHHRLDAPAWKRRYPQMQIVAPPGCRERVQQVVPVDTTTPAFGDAAVDFVTVAGTAENEGALVVRRERGTTLVLNDIVGNIRGARGVGGALLRAMGFAGDVPRVPRLVKRVLIKDPAALRAQLLRWADIGALARIVVSHGEIVVDDAGGVLRRLAASLA